MAGIMGERIVGKLDENTLYVCMQFSVKRRNYK